MRRKQIIYKNQITGHSCPLCGTFCSYQGKNIKKPSPIDLLACSEFSDHGKKSAWYAYKTNASADQYP